MKKESFEKLDHSFMAKLQPERDRSVPPEILKDFGVGVTYKIAQRKQFLPAGWGLVPATMALALGFWVVSSIPSPVYPVAQPAFHAIQAEEKNIDQSILELQNLGAWTDEDEDNLILNGAGLALTLEFLNATPAGIPT